MGTRLIHKLVEKETLSRSSTILRKKSQLILRLRIQGPLVRVYDAKTELIIVREAEIRNALDAKFSNKTKNYFDIKTHTCVIFLTYEMYLILRSSLFQEPHI